MKEIQNALIPVCIAAVALAGVPRLASARDSRDATPITASNGKDQFLLVEASAPGAKKQPAKAPNSSTCWLKVVPTEMGSVGHLELLD